MRSPWLLGILFTIFGCGASSGDDGTPGEEQDLTSTPPSAEEAKACEDGSVGTDATGASVVHCHKPFPTAPFVRLPADSATSFYGGITVPTTVADIAVIWSRDGKRFAAVDSSGKPIAFGGAGSKLPKTLHAPTNRITFTLYQFTGTLGAELDTPYGKATAITLKSARPVVELDGCAFDSRLLGTFTGTVSERLATPSGSGPWAKAFDESKRVPIHVTLDTIAKSTTLAEYKGGGKLTDADTYQLRGTIDNFDKDVTVGGTKYPSLTAMGATNPFAGAKDGKIELYRLGNMHGQMNDGHWVFTYPAGSQTLSGNGMSYTLSAFTAPTWLFDADVKADDLQSVTIKPHIPFVSNGHSIILTPENVGARVGTCH